MKVVSMVPEKLNDEMTTVGGHVVTVVAMVALLLSSATVQAASENFEEDVTLVDIRGSQIKQVILSQKAAKKG